MRYIGNKENLLDKISFILDSKEITGKSFFDFFSGTTNVAQYFKKLGYQIYSSDILYLSYCLQKAYIANNENPLFDKLLQNIDVQPESLFPNSLELVVKYLNSLPPKKGFIYNNYTPGGTPDLQQPRMYFSDKNGEKIDAIRFQIESWNNSKLLTENEYYILLACLIEAVPFFANISGVYAAFLKKWDPRAIKPFRISPIEIITNKYQNFVYNIDSVMLCKDIDVDILYLDPPYNGRQYAPNYHLLETIARYDNPIIKGVTGMRNYQDLKSKFCNAKTAIEELDNVAKNAKYKHLVLSYNTEGIMPQEKIIKTLEKYGEVILEEFEYLRFKSNNNGLSKTKKHIFEQLYMLKKA